MTCALLGLMRVVAAGWAYRGRRGEGLECAIICGVAIVGQIGWVEVCEWIWLGGGRVIWGRIVYGGLWIWSDRVD